MPISRIFTDAMPTRFVLTRTLVAGALLAGLAGTARAGTLSATLQGSGLAVDTPCARSVEIMPDAGLHGQVTVQATAEHQEELDHLLLESRGIVLIHTHPGRCWQDGLNTEPTLALVVRVPAAYAITVDEAGASRYTIGAVGGPLSLDLSGAIDFTDEAATSVQADISGSGSLHVARADGAAQIAVSGHADITVEQAEMPTLSMDMSGAGSIDVAHGHIGRARLETSGAGHMQIGAEVGDAHVEVSGVGSVHFAKVTGQLTKEISGAGSVTVQ